MKINLFFNSNFSGKYVSLTSYRKIIEVIATTFPLYFFYFVLFRPIPIKMYALIWLGISLLLFYMQILFQKKDRTKSDVVVFSSLSLASFILAMYVVLNYYTWLDYISNLDFGLIDLLVGFLIMVVVLDASWRRYGKVYTIAVLAVLIYAYFGYMVPGIFRHGGLSLEYIIFYNTISFSGALGNLLRIGATWVFSFLLLAGFFRGFGAFDLIKNIALEISHKLKSGYAQTAVVGSMLMGQISGAQAGNVAATGSFTIPLMIEKKIPREVAGGIESVASTGGQIMPPIMGVAAFVMADILGITYARVMIGSLIPALLFYTSVAISVDFYVRKNGWMAGTEIKKSINKRVFLEGTRFILPLGVLAYTLVFWKFDPMMSTVVSLISLLIIETPYKLFYRKIPVSSFLEEIRRGLKYGSETSAEMAPILASIGIIITTLSIIGLPHTFGTLIISFGGKSLFILLILIAITCIIFGMGMPTVAAYILVASIVAPPLIQVSGVNPLVGHLFILYFAVISAITPPVAICCAVASSISKASFISVVRESLKIGAGLFIIPFVFFFRPSLVLWSFPETAIDFAISAFAIMLFSMAFIGYNGFKKLNLWYRILFGVFGALLIIKPQPYLELPVILIALALLSLELTKKFSDHPESD